MLKGTEYTGCPYCDGKLSIPHYAGLVEITADYYAGGPIGGGVNVHGVATEEYQFHYYRCDTCGEGWQMFEYRETPSWWDDFWGIDPDFKKGDIITPYLMEQVASHKYKSHAITRW